MPKDNPCRRAAGWRGLLPMLAVALIGAATAATAQTVVTGPDARLFEVPASPRLPGLVPTQAIGGVVLQRPDSVAAASAAQVPSTRLRAVAAPGGAWVLEDSLPSVALAAAQAGSRSLARVDVGGAGLLRLDIMAQAEAAPSPTVKGQREVVLTTPAEIERALAQPEPKVLYRLAAPRP